MKGFSLLLHQTSGQCSSFNKFTYTIQCIRLREQKGRICVVTYSYSKKLTLQDKRNFGERTNFEEEIEGGSASGEYFWVY